MAMTNWITQAWAEQKIELLGVGILFLFMLIVIIYVIFFRKKKPRRADLQIDEMFLQQRKMQPSKDDILNALIHFSDYPTFIKILTDVLNNFTMEYLYSYGELSKAFNRLMDFSKTGNSVSAHQRAAMITMVRIFMTSDFINKKCSDILDDNFDRFMEETNQVS